MFRQLSVSVQLFTSLTVKIKKRTKIFAYSILG